jgi:hypothetical protein
VPVSRGNIGHGGGSFSYHFSDIVRFWHWTENPRVGGSIPPLATIRIKILNQGVASERMDCLSNISAGVQYSDPLFT